MADAISTVTSTADAVKELTKSQQSKQKLAEDLDQFMVLLTTQLKHQDPLDPMDSNEFTSQLVQFASVEQQIQGNTNLEALLQAQENSQMAAVASYIGHNVEAQSQDLQLVDGKAEFNYILHDTAAATTILITDQGGRTVFQAEGNVTPGKHGVEWDGTGLGGEKLADGPYKIMVSALDKDGAPVDVTHSVIGKVTGVNYAGDEPLLTINNSQEISLDKVLLLREIVASSTTTTDTTTDTTTTQ